MKEEASEPGMLNHGRLAYSMKEAAVALGVSYTSVWRLVKRGKLRCCSALRNKLIPHFELERFLRESLSEE